MRRALVVVALAACRGDAPADKPAPAPKVATEPAPPLPIVDLVHETPTTITVSSRVENASISPEQLVDGDLATAWNSKTGDLVGAYVDVALPADAILHELRMTAGNTAAGPKGEDYFAMNHRIARITVLQNGAPIGGWRVDPQSRELQGFPLGDVRGGAPIRIRVDEVVPGTKRDWREVCISELQILGTVPPALRHVEPPRVTTAD